MPPATDPLACPAQRARLAEALASVGGSLADWEAGKYWPGAPAGQTGPLVVFTITGVPTRFIGWQPPVLLGLATGPRVAYDHNGDPYDPDHPPTGAEYVVLDRASGKLVLRLDRYGRLHRYR